MCAPLNSLAAGHMDVAALRRLQHRMEARGRAAQSCVVNCDYSRPHCTCVPRHQHDEGGARDDTEVATASNYIDKQGNNGNNSIVTLSGAARSWLVQRLEDIEVDITGGAAQHSRAVPCCCSCCQGYHHSYHEPKVGSNVYAGCLNGKGSEKGQAATPSVSEVRADCIQQQADGSPTVVDGRINSSSPAPRTYDVPTLRGTQNVLKPAKSSKLLHALLRNAQMVAVPAKAREWENVPESEPDTPSRSAGSTLESAKRVFRERKRAATVPKTHSATESTRTSTVRTRSSSLLPTDRQHRTATETATEGYSQPPSVTVYPHVNREVSQRPVGVSPGDAATDTSPLKSVVERSVQCTPLVTSASTQRALALSVAIQTEDVADPSRSFPKGSSGSLVGKQLQQSSSTSTNGPATLSAEVTSLTSRSGASESHEQGSAGRHVSNTKATTATMEPSPTEVINALREKLLLEKADAYVRLLEQQVSGELHTKGRVEEEEAHARSHNQERILSLLSRLHQEDREIMEALYDAVNEKETLEQPRSLVASSLPVSSPSVSASASVPPPGQSFGDVSQESMQTSARPVYGKNSFPEEVLAAYEQFSAEPSPHPKPPAGMTPLTTAGSPQTEVSQGSMRAWVDRYFSDSLDPQHRALLHHVLLSREAEVRRAEAAESQCRKLKSRLCTADAPSLMLTEGSGKHESQKLSVPAVSGGNEEEPKVPDLRRDGSGIKSSELSCSMPPPAPPRTENLPSRGNDQAVNACGANPSATSSSSRAVNEEELQRWKSRCDAIEQQHRASVHRLAELQTYIEQLRRDAHQAVVKVATASTVTVPTAPNLPTTTLPQPNESTVQMSSVRDMWSPGSGPTRGVSDTLSFTQPPSSTCQPHSTVAPLSTFERPSKPATEMGPLSGVTPPTSLYPTSVPTTTTVQTSTGNREAALQMLREELDAECSRFADESRRWQQFVETQRISLQKGKGG